MPETNIQKATRATEDQTRGRANQRCGWGVLILLSLCACEDAKLPALLQQSTPTPTAQEAPPHRYVRPVGVEFHVKGILGMSWHDFQGSDQETYLGKRTGEEKLPGLRGRLFVYGQGALSVVRDEIYHIRYQFPRPVSRLEAMHMLGLPESMLGELKETSKELTVERSSYGFRRFSLLRSAVDKDEYIEVQAWKFLPIERQ